MDIGKNIAAVLALWLLLSLVIPLLTRKGRRTGKALSSALGPTVRLTIWWGIFVGILLVLWYKNDWLADKNLALALFLAALFYRWLGNKWKLNQTLPWIIVLLVAVKIFLTYLAPPLLSDWWSSLKTDKPTPTSTAIQKNWTRAELEQKADQYAVKAGLEPKLVRALIQAESDWNPKAVSRKGAMGLMQLMPATARRYGVNNPFDPDQNLRAGTRYLRDLLSRYGGNELHALAAYNWGERRVDKLIARGFVNWDQMQPRLPQETRGYVRAIFASLGKPLAPLTELAKGVIQSGRVWQITAHADRITPVNLKLPAGRYRITIPATDCVTWDRFVECAPADGGGYTPQKVKGGEEFFAFDVEVGKPLLFVNGKIYPLGNQVELDFPQPATVEAVVTNDRRHRLSDNRGRWHITIEKVG